LTIKKWLKVGKHDALSGNTASGLQHDGEYAREEGGRRKHKGDERERVKV
jgi:hypothetical protein